MDLLNGYGSEDSSSGEIPDGGQPVATNGIGPGENTPGKLDEPGASPSSPKMDHVGQKSLAGESGNCPAVTSGGTSNSASTDGGMPCDMPLRPETKPTELRDDPGAAETQSISGAGAMALPLKGDPERGETRADHTGGEASQVNGAPDSYDTAPMEDATSNLESTTVSEVPAKLPPRGKTLVKLEGDSAADEDQSAAMGEGKLNHSGDVDSQMNGVAASSSNKSSGDGQNAAKDSAEVGSAAALRGTVVPSQKKTFDWVEYSSAYQKEGAVKESDPAASLKPASTALPPDDARNHATKRDENDAPSSVGLAEEHSGKDVYLNVKKDSGYRGIMFAQFKKLGLGSKVDESVVNEVFDELKTRGRIFRQPRGGAPFEEADDAAALKVIRYHFRSRNSLRRHWHDPNATEQNSASFVTTVDKSGQPIESTTNDVFLSLHNPTYKATMHATFQQLGPGNNVPEEALTEVFHQFKASGGRFFRQMHQRSEFQEVDDDIAIQAMRDHIRRRDGSISRWNGAPSPEDRDEIEYSANDVFLNLNKDPGYKALMFEQFKKLGPGQRVPDERVVNEVFQALKKRGGRFFRVTHASHDIHDEIGDEAALEIIKKHMQYRNRTSEEWYDPNTAAKYSEKDVFLNVTKDPEYKTLMYAHFKEMGRGNDSDESRVQEVLQALKKRGGRIFKVAHASHDIHDEVGDEAALEIMRSHMKRRNATSKDWLDPIEYQPDDIFLNMKKDPEYKALMFAQFKKLGLGSKAPEENVVNDVFQALKARGGRFFKLIPHSSTAYEEANEAAALKTIRGHFQQRNTSRQHWHDPNATEQNSDYKPNDVFLNVNKDPEYKALMFAQYKKLGLGSKVDESAVNEVLQALKNRGGRFFKVVPHHNSYEEVDEAAALTAIRGHMGRRNQCSDQWYGDNEKTPASFAPAVDSTKKLPTEVVSLLDDDDDMLHFGSRPGRKRQKPQSFMDAQGQDMLVREELARRWRAYSKKGRKGANDSKPFSPNEIRAFEQGCTAHGWGSWEFVVNEFLPERTVEECEQLASIIMELQPEMRERLLGEHDGTWVRKGPKSPPVVLPSQADALKSPTSNGSAQPSKKIAAAASPKKYSRGAPKGLSPVGAEPCEDLGVGWTIKKIARKNVKDGGTKADKFYFSPEGKQFRSMAEARRYLDGESANTGKKEKRSAREGKGAGADPSASKNRAATSSKKRAKRLSSEEVKRAETGAAAGNSNDVYLNFKKDPGYKALMFAHFKEMGYATNVDDGITNEVLRTLKKRGGRIFKLPKYKSIYEEADDEGALKTIDWHFRNRKASYDEWGKDSASNVQVPIPRKERHQSIPSQSQSKPKAAANTGTKAKRSKSGSSAQPTNATELALPKAKRMKRDDAARESGVAQPVDAGNDAGRPKRQSALKARQYLQEHTSFDGDEDEGGAPGSAAKKDNAAVIAAAAAQSAVVSNITKLEKETEQLLKDLSDRPSQDTFEEESAWRFHNPPFPGGSKQQLTEIREDAVPNMLAPTPPGQLQPLPSAPPLPHLPSTGHCDWSFDETSRVLRADFTRGGQVGQIKVDPKDEAFLYRMMERDDITVISDGLAESINPTIWSRNYIEGCIGQDFHHKFRGFEAAQEGDIDQQPNGQPKEKEGWYSMKVADYFRYLDQRQSVKKAKADGAEANAETPNEEFTFVDSDGDTKSVNVDKESLYMIDVDLPKLLPRAFEDLQRNFKLPEILPGGSHCMMNAINANGRPFMGPNLYITPPCSFTHFHQDGHGTVDSGHLCLSGYNEVVMLRRLTERHKCHALNLLTGTSEPHNTLYGLPHRDDLGTQPGWPSKAAIEKCKSMQYYPSVFVLKPGQLVHINKGRLHAFRKLAPAPLRPTDCHADLRQEVLTELERKGVKTEVLCFSVAWDWMYKGVTSEGINREVSGILECARLNRIHDLQSLAIPETSLVFLAKENIARHQQTSNADESRTLFSIETARHQTPTSEPDAKTVLRGILPSLQYVVNRHNSSVKFSMEWAAKTKRVKNSWRVSIDSKPNTWQNPESFALDPYGAGDMKCKFCNEELSNVYMHCDGCEKLLNKDFNICSTCHRGGRYRQKVLMHPFNEKAHSIHNHTGNPKESRRSRCPCKNGKECVHCGFCTGCSCRCHQWFTLHYRFMSLDAELDILGQAESIVGSDVIAHSNETKARLFSLISDRAPGDESQPNNASICQVVDESKSAPIADTVPSSNVQKEAAISVKETQLDTKPSALPKGNEEAKDDGEQASVSFHCTKCGKDFAYENAQVAPAAFKSHTAACKRKHEEMDAADRGSPGGEAKENGDVPQSTTPHIDPDEVEEGDRVIVADDRGEPWQATILERHERLCQDGFRIHWDGTKKGKVDWVECTRIVNFIPGDAGGGSPDAEAGDSDDEPLISHRSW